MLSKPIMAIGSGVGVLISVSCLPYRGAEQLPIPVTPIQFIDSETREPVEHVLVISRYSSFSGISTGAGHGPGAGSDRCYLADPFLYERGTPFSPRQPKSGDVIWGPGWAFTGKGICIDGVTIIARGYRTIWVWDLWQESSRRNPVLLKPVAASEVESELQFVRNLLLKSKLVGHEADLFGYCGGSIETRFHKDDMVMVQGFLDPAAQR